MLPDRREPAALVPPLPEDRRRGPRRLGDLLRRLGSTDVTRPRPAQPRAAAAGGRAAVPVADGVRCRRPTWLRWCSAGRAFADGHYREAVALADQALRVDPMAAAPHYLRGHALPTWGDERRA